MKKSSMVGFTFSLFMACNAGIAYAAPSDVIDKDHADPVVMGKFKNDMALAMKATSDSISNASGCSLVKKALPKDTKKWLYDIGFLYWHGNIDRDQFIYLGQHEKPHCTKFFEVLSNKLPQQKN